MPELDFQVEAVEAVPYAAAPLLHFKMSVKNANPEEQIQTVALRCQINIEPTRRRYSDEEKRRMLDLFGETERWGKTMKSMLWTHADTVVSPFTGETSVNLPVNCTFDFNIAATKYFAGLEDGEIPLLFLFSGTVFYQNEFGAMQISQISWNKESNFSLPASVWQEMMEAYYPNSNWLRLEREAFERLLAFKTKHGILTWEQTLDKLLPEEEIEIKEQASGFTN
ncbi:MAG: DUF6084 family protein [Aridibacter sp.]